MKRGAENPNWRGGRRRGGEGMRYWLRYAPEHPNARAGYVLEHRLVMESELGRLLERTEIVHHINHDPLDNRPENLAVLSQAQHMDHHGIHEIDHSGPRLPRLTLACEECSTSFEALHPQRFCSRPCYWAYRRRVGGQLQAGVQA